MGKSGTTNKHIWCSLRLTRKVSWILG